MKISLQLARKFILVTISAYLSTTTLSHPAWAAKMYKWVDADGKVSYQDKPPPKSGKLIDTSELQNSSPATTSKTVNQGLSPVTVYTIANCGDCAQLMTFLKKAEVPVVELSLQDRAVQSRILRLSGKIAAPTLFIGDSLVTDLSDAGLVLKLKNSGYTLPESLDPKTPTPNTKNAEANAPNDQPVVNGDTRTRIEKRIDEIRNRSASEDLIRVE